MPRRHPVWSRTLVAMAALSVLTGCGERPPDTDELVLYIRNARVGGKVRRQWSAGQAYLDKVLQADSRARAALAPFIKLAAPASLPKLDAANWRSISDVEKRLTAVDDLFSDKSARERQKLLDELAAAVTELPGAPTRLFPTRAAGMAFADSVWDALRWEDADIREAEDELRPFAERHRLWLATLRQQAAVLKEKGSAASAADLHDAAQQLATAYATSQTALHTRRQAADEAARRGFADAEARLADLRAEKEALRRQFKERPKTDEDTRRLGWIEDRIDYEMARRKKHETACRAIGKRPRAEQAETQPSEDQLLKVAESLAAALAGAKP